MPHIVVEYSTNLEEGVDIRRLVDDLHQTMVGSGLFELSAIRTRAMPRNVYRIADGNPENIFIHVIARIRQGRSVDERKKLGTALLDTVKRALDTMPAAKPVALGVEIHEIDPEMLFRHITIK